MSTLSLPSKSLVKCLTLLLCMLGCHGSLFALERTPEVQAFIDELAETSNLDPARIGALLDQAQFRQDIIDAMERPAEAKPWYQYRKIFLTEQRIQGGVRYWQQHAALLDQVMNRFGVDPAVVVAIIGVETRYGGFLGKHRILDALATLGFSYPKRANFFRKELGEFLVLAERLDIDPLTALGSYAGAMGKPQFIPSSYRSYAIDFDGDGRTDLWNSDADIIGSIANYLHRHKWQAQQAITSRALGVDAVAHQRFLDAGLKPAFTLEDYLSAGITPETPLPAELPASLIGFELADGTQEYWLGLTNFYAITRYNHSPLYAMAVYQLSQAIQSARKRMP